MLLAADSPREMPGVMTNIAPKLKYFPSHKALGGGADLYFSTFARYQPTNCETMSTRLYTA